MDKAKARFDQTAEELERILVAKEGETFRDAGMRSANAANAAAGNGLPPAGGKKGIGKAMTKGLFKGKNPAQMAKHEDDVRARMASTSEAFRKACLESQALRQEYFNFQLPKIVRVSLSVRRRRAELTVSTSRTARMSLTTECSTTSPAMRTCTSRLLCPRAPCLPLPTPRTVSDSLVSVLGAR